MSSTTASPVTRGERAPWGAELRIGLVLFFAFFLSVVGRTAWVSDDAYIDARTAVNAASGEGLRWNVDERVETFTDPAWVLLLSAASVFVRDPYVALLLLDVTLAAAAVALIVMGLAADAAAAVLALSLLTFSKAFVEYATSGLSVALVYLLIAMFWTLYWRMRDRPARTRVLTTIAAICMLADAKAVLLLMPALLVVLRRRLAYRVADVAPAIAVLAGWALFATLYFGSPVPAPVMAAWTAHWQLSARAGQGLVYLLDAVDRDPLTVLAIACAIALLCLRQLTNVRVVAAGVLVYFTAVVLAGGDWLSGRAFAPALLTTAILIARLDWISTGYASAAVALLIWGLGLLSPYSPVRSDVHYGRTAQEPLAAPWPGERSTMAPSRAAIRDDRWDAYQQTGLLTARHDAALPDVQALEREVQQLLVRNQHVVVTDRVGLFAFVSGTRLHVVDPLGRTDPLLSRLAPADCCTPRGGRRAIPDGYVETIETGRNVIADPPTAELYRRVSTLAKAAHVGLPRLSASSP